MENESNFGYEKITILVDNMSLNNSLCYWSFTGKTFCNEFSFLKCTNNNTHEGFVFLFKINNIGLLGLKVYIFRFEVLKLFLFQNLEFFFAIYNFPKIRGCKQGDLLIFGQKYKMLSNIKYLYAS